MMIGIHHSGISTPNLERLRAFYSDLLGFQILAEEFVVAQGSEESKASDPLLELENSAFRLAVLKLGDFQLDLIEFSSPKPKPRDARPQVCDYGIDHLCFLVDDCDKEYERLTAAGMEFHAPPADAGFGMRLVYGRDPDGNLVQLLSISGDGPPVG